MDFQKYINHSAQLSTDRHASTSKSQQRPRVIKFVGDMQQNIKQLLVGINCNCGSKKEFYNILVVFASKIQKLRTEREHYKTTLKEYLLTMNNNSTVNQLVQKSNRNSTDRKHKEINKKEFGQTVKIHIHNSQNQSPLTKVLNLFQKNRPKALIINETLVNETSRDKENQQVRNNFTAVKKPFIEDWKQTRTEDKKMSYFYKTQQQVLKQVQKQIKNQKEETSQQLENDGSFSLNLSSFEDVQKLNQTSEFTKSVSSIMNETNLLDSDNQQNSFKTPSTKQQSTAKSSDSQVDKLKLLKQSTNFQEILLSLNDEDLLEQLKIDTKKCINKRKENPEEITTQKKIVRKSERFNDKENVKAESCLKKYNISIQKLEEFIENKQCLKQLQKTQQYDFNLKNFKSIASCSLRKEPSTDFDTAKRSVRPARPLEERRFNFNI